MRLGVNIDHIATLRQARQDVYPDLIQAATEAFKGGADGITIHLREDRRHIQDKDVWELKSVFPRKHINLEMALNPEIIEIAIKLNPPAVCIVPEKRTELTTEGGLDVISKLELITKTTERLQKAGIQVSLFINAEKDQIKAANRSGADAIELHTGAYGEYSDPERPEYDPAKAKKELDKLVIGAAFAKSLGLLVNAGHGLTYDNVKPLAKFKELFNEFNIGHNIVARAAFVGLRQAVREMKKLIR